MISLILPTLNERESLERLFPELSKMTPSIKEPLEIVIVDDGSTDGTPEYCEEIRLRLPFKINLIKRSERGLATAVIRGFKEAQGEILCVLDADLSHPPSVVPKLYEAIKNGAEIAVGSRYMKGGGVEEWPMYRKIFSYIPTLLARPISNGVRDPLSGFFCFKKEALKGIQFKVIGYKILLEILVKTNAKKIVEIPYIFRNRGVGESKLNSRIALQYFKHLGKLYQHKLRKK